eukprot:5752824-Amphidinium_carterae.1
MRLRAKTRTKASASHPPFTVGNMQPARWWGVGYVFFQGRWFSDRSTWHYILMIQIDGLVCKWFLPVAASYPCTHPFDGCQVPALISTGGMDPSCLSAARIL